MTFWLITRREVRVVQFAKKQEPRSERLHSAEPWKQSAGGPLRIAELRVVWELGGLDDSRGTARHSWNRNDASR